MMRCPFCGGDGVIDAKGPDGRRIVIEAKIYCIESDRHHPDWRGICPNCTLQIGPFAAAGRT
jgi:hypothetical protein